jgi:opacity protein-like surface antigen
MRKAFVLAAVSAAAALSAATAHAAIYTVHIDGQLIEQLGEGSDPQFGVGTPITLDTTFDSSKIVDWGGTGYQVAFLWYYSTSYVINLAGLKTYAWDDYRDGYGGFHVDLGYRTPDGGPAWDHRDYPGQVDIIFKDGKIVGTTGSFAPAGNNPGIKLANGVIYGELSAPPSDPGNLHVVYSPLPLGNTFEVGANRYYYQNNYGGPGFIGQWDFDNARVSIDPVPEPAAWALMIVGFGLVGSAIRRRGFAA